MQYPHQHETLSAITEILAATQNAADLVADHETTPGTMKIVACSLALKIAEAHWIATELVHMAETGNKSPRSEPPWIGHLETHLRRRTTA